MKSRYFWTKLNSLEIIANFLARLYFWINFVNLGEKIAPPENFRNSVGGRYLSPRGAILHPWLGYPLQVSPNFCVVRTAEIFSLINWYQWKTVLLVELAFHQKCFERVQGSIPCPQSLKGYSLLKWKSDHSDYWFARENLYDCWYFPFMRKIKFLKKCNFRRRSDYRLEKM